MTTNWLTYHDPPRKLHSGDESHWFVDADKIYADERLREEVLLWMRSQPPLDHDLHLVGIPRGGRLWGEAFAGRGPLSYRLTCGPPDGHIPNGTIVYIIDDVVTTGASLLDAYSRLQLPESSVFGSFLAVVDRRMRPEALLVNAWLKIKLR